MDTVFSVSLETKEKAEQNARSLEEKLSSIELHRKSLKKVNFQGDLLDMCIQPE